MNTKILLKSTESYEKDIGKFVSPELQARFNIMFNQYKDLLVNKLKNNPEYNQIVILELLNTISTYGSTTSTEEIENNKNAKKEYQDAISDKHSKLKSDLIYILNFYSKYNDYELPDRFRSVDLIDIHSSIFKNKVKSGFRNKNVWIPNVVEFVDHERINYFVEDILMYMNSKRYELPSDVIINGAFIHTYLIGIHPFLDGNGRISRFIMDKFISKHLGINFYVTESINNSIHGQYNKALNQFHLEGNSTSIEIFVLEAAIKQIELNTKRIEEIQLKYSHIKSLLSESNIKEKYHEKIIIKIIKNWETNSRWIWLGSLAKDLEVTQPTAISILKELQRIGLVSTEPTLKGRTKIYDILLKK